MYCSRYRLLTASDIHIQLDKATLLFRHAIARERGPEARCGLDYAFAAKHPRIVAWALRLPLILVVVLHCLACAHRFIRDNVY